ncbi:nuclear transport factor 2 family protein [Pseudomonas aeruginosa]|nr:nuclear transport factor 2 family protein [Pseudomonas aeruginosa]MDY1449800.1 nuclear transport factor 2 family protein [Pseudomonas aeruginosa]HEJ2935046.1 nuclear transport factor 2 family protein [Pseudomonas aeruginosa]
MSSVTVELIEGIVGAFNRHDVEAVLEYFHDDGEMLGAVGPEIWGVRLKGRDAIREALVKRFAGMPDIRWTEGKSWVVGNRAVSEFRVMGTQASGEKLDLMGCDLWEFLDGKVYRKDTYYKQVVKR